LVSSSGRYLPEDTRLTSARFGFQWSFSAARASDTLDTMDSGRAAPHVELQQAEQSTSMAIRSGEE
jgi:hypothetical protein